MKWIKKIRENAVYAEAYHEIEFAWLMRHPCTARRISAIVESVISVMDKEMG